MIFQIIGYVIKTSGLESNAAVSIEHVEKNFLMARELAAGHLNFDGEGLGSVDPQNVRNSFDDKNAVRLSIDLQLLIINTDIIILPGPDSAHL